MSVLKLSKNDINEKRDDNKIKLKRSDISYDSAMVSGWETTNKASVEALNGFYDRINKNEWLSQEDLATYRKTLDSYIDTYNRLRKLGNNGSDEEEKKWQDSVTSLNTEYDNISNYYTQFGTENAFKEHRDYVAKQERYKELANSEDAVKGWDQYLADEAKAKESKPKTSTWAETIIRGFTTASDNPINMAFNNAVYDYRNDDGYKKPNDQWTEEQQRTFGALWLSNKDEATQYAIDTNNAINQAIKDDKLKEIQENATSSFGEGFAHSIGAIFAGVTGLADIMDDFAEYAGRGTITTDSFVTPYEYSQAVTEGISTNLNEISGVLDEDIPVIGGKGLGDVYGLGMSIGQSALSGYAFGSVGTLINYFGSGAASAVDDALARGETPEKALAFGVLNGLSEGIPEALGIDNLFKIGSSTTLKSFFKNVLKQAGAEFLEEGATSVLNAFADNLVMGDKSNFYTLVEHYMSQGMSEEEAKRKAWTNYAEDVAFDMLAGGISGGIHGGIHTGIKTAVNNHKTNKVYGTSAQELVSETLEISPEGSKNVLLADKYQKRLDSGKKLTGGQLAELININEQAYRDNDIEKMKSATEARLTQLGEKGDVSTLAEVIVKQASGETLTRSETKILENSRYGQRVSNEMSPENIKTGGYTSDWAKNIGTERINAEEYNDELHQLAGDVNGVKDVSESHTDDESSQETADESVYQHSYNGKTYYKDENGDYKEASSIEISSIKNGEVFIRTDNGEEINAKDVSFGSEDEALMIEMVANLGVSPETAMSMIDSYNKGKGTISAQMYRADAPLAYKYGTIEYTKGLANLNLTEDQKITLFGRGRTDSMNNIKAKQAKVDASKTGNTRSKHRKVTYLDGAKAIGGRRKSAVKLIEVLSESIGNHWYVFSSYVENGKRVYKDIDGVVKPAPNGKYDPKTGDIYIDLNAGQKGEGLMVFTMAHELTHFIRQWSPAKFKVFADFLIEQYGEKGVPVERLIQYKIKRAESNGRKLSYDEAYEEVIADSCETMLRDSNAIEAIAKLKAKDATIWEKIKSFISKLVAKIKAAYEGLNPDSEEANHVREMVDVAEKLQALWTEALVDAGETYQTIGSRDLSELSEAKTTDGKELFQYRAMEVDKDDYRAMLLKHGLMTNAEIDNLFSMIDKALDVIKNNLEALDYAWDVDINDRAFMPVKPNSDKLYAVSLDFSTLCRKRLLQQTIQATLQEALNKPLSKEEGIAIRDELMKIQEEGRQIEIACALCYVESARMKSPAQIKKFLKNRESVLIDFFAGRAGGSTSEKIKQAEADARAKLHKENPNGISGKNGTIVDPRTASLSKMMAKYADQIRKAKKDAKLAYKPTPNEQKMIDAVKGMKTSDFTSPEGLENLAKNYSDIFDAYTSFVRNATHSKGIEKDTWWRAGDSDGLIGQALIDRMNAENGLRSQSWSDFQVIHLLDYIAATIELSTKNAKRQSYTKVADYVILLGNTGDMINMSLIPMAKYNGKLEYDSVEGIDYKTSLELRDKYHATAGTICIGIDNAQIKQLLADGTIDYVIPYHKSSMSQATKKLMHIPSWFDYEPYQSESVLSSADAKENAKKYGVELLDKSDKNYNKSTKFSDWFDLKEAQQIAKMENANPSDPAMRKKYGVMYGAYKAMQNAANNYLKLCAERGLSPKFSHENADFTAEENYWKLLIDRKMVDNVTGEIIEQKAIKPVFDEADVLGILNRELEKYPQVKADQEYATRKVVEKFLSGDMKVDKDTREAIKKTVDNVTVVNIEASSDGLKLSDRDSSWRDVDKIQGLEDYSVEEVTDIVRQYIEDIAMEIGEEISIIDIRPYGSRSRGTAKKSSDLDVVVQYEGDIREDDMFNMLNDVEDKLSIDGIEVDINPIKADDTGTIEEYLDRVYGYDKYSDTKYSDRDLAPTFYSQMGKVVEGMKQDKFAASSVVSMFRGRGVKAEEIRWSGIATWLEGKKSVTKQELQEFIAGSQLQIGEQMSGNNIDLRYNAGERSYTLYDKEGNVIDTYTYNEFMGGYVSELDDEIYSNANELEDAVREEYGEMSSPIWSQYKLDGGSNYREIVFTLPNSTYSNRAMKGHWGQDAEGILVHARIQDFVVNGKVMLFIEEIQSDWHNEGHSKGYSNKEYEDAVETHDKLYNEYKKMDLAFHKYVRSNDFRTDPEDVRKKKHDWLRGKVDTAQKKYLDAEKVVNSLKEKGAGDTPDAPFKDTYHEFVLKRLLRMAAEQGYDSIGWTPAEIQVKRWSEEFAEGYRIEYDQDMPKFMRKYGRQWGATVGKTNINDSDEVTYTTVNGDKYKSIREWFDDVSEQLHKVYGDKLKGKLTVKEDGNTLYVQNKVTGQKYARLMVGNEKAEVWSMDITDSMKDSVLHEGQVLYSDRDFASQVDDVLNGKDTTSTHLQVRKNTPKIFLEVGLEDKPMLITSVHAKTAVGQQLKGKNIHNINVETFKNLPKLLEKPAIIMESTRKDSIVAFVNAVDNANMPIMCAINITGRGYYNSIEVDANLISSVYGKDSNPIGFIERAVEEDRVLYWDKKMSQDLFEIPKLQLPDNLNSLDSNTIIRKAKAFVKSFSENSSKKFSDRDPNSVSNRSLLANALESAVQNDIERNKLTQYKEKIDLINSEEAKLHELNGKIRDILFSKGARDSTKLRDLQFEAKQTANRINTYDRQLLTLEASKPLKAVLEREKKLAYEKAEKEGVKALLAYREKAAKTTRELMNRYQESRARATEGRHKTEYRNKIKKVVGDLNKLLLRPTKDKHIKEGLKVAVAEALSVINMDTVGAEERIARLDELIAKANDPNIIAELTATRDRIEVQGENLKDKLTALQTAYEKIKNSTDPELKNAYQEPVMNAIKNVVDVVGNTSIREMSLTQLDAVYEMYSMILHTVRTANKAFKAKKGETITQISEAVNDEIRKISKEKFTRNPVIAGLRKVGWTLLKPLTAFRTIGSDTFTGLYNELRNGEDVFYVDINEAKTFIQNQYKKHNFKSWDQKQTKTFTAKSGKTFTLTLEQMMSLYAYSRRDQAYDHIIEGGIVLEDSVIETKNKLGLPVKYKVDTKSAFNISEETLAEICDSLTAEQKGFVEEMQAYLSDVMGAKGNEVSMELLGVQLFKEKFYFPLKSSKYYMGFKPEEAGEIKLKNPAFSKETVQHANNPVVLKGFTDVWATHINDMSMYHAFVLPLEDFTRVYNYKTKTDALLETMSTEATIANAFGEGATQYIRNFLRSLNGGVRTESVGIADKAVSLSKKGAVLGSASVMIQQPSAIMRAMALINPIHFVASTHKSINLVKHNKDWAELKQYAPIAGIKEMGRFDVGMGQSTVKWIKDQDTILEKADEILSKAPAFMDEVTWVGIWNAVKNEVKHKHKDLAVGSEAYLKKCGERFTEVVSLTQVYDSVFSRSDIMRNQSWIAKALTAFMAEPSTTLNMLVDSFIQGKRTGKVGGFVKVTAGTLGAIVGSIVLNAALKSIITAMRDDDEDESYVEKYLGAFVGNATDDLNPLSYIPFVKDIVSIFNGYDVERMDMALFSDLKYAIDAFDSDSKTEYEKWTGLIGAISAFAGIPFKNVERDIRGAVNTIKSFSEGEKTTGAGIKNSIRESLTGKETSNTKQLYEAYLSDDKEQIKRVEGRFEDKSDIESALRKALRENDSRIKEAAQAVIDGNHAERIRLTREIIAEGHFKQDIVIGAINAELTAIKRELNEQKDKD